MARLLAYARTPRALRGLLVVGFLLLLAWQVSAHSPLTTEDIPYEGWDEVTTYNAGRVLSGPAANAVYRYGSLDSLIQIVANQYFLLFDPLGPQYRHYSYSNNAYGSLNDEFYVYSKMGPGELEYNYFRGIDDHRPIFISRALHFDVFYALVAMAGLLWIAVLGVESLWLILPMLCLTANREVFEQAANALPNGINIILSFVIVTLIGLALETRRDALFYLAAIGLALATNFKIDIAPLGPVLALALIWRGVAEDGRRTARPALIAFGAFLVTLIATKPGILTAPQELLAWLSPPVARLEQAAVPSFVDKLLVLIRELKIEMLPAAWQYYVPTAVMPAALLVAAAVVVGTLRRQPTALGRLILPALAVLLLWFIPMALVSEFFGRYVLNGIGACYALIGIALLCLRRYGAAPGRLLAAVLTLLLIGQYGLMIRDGAAHAAYVVSRNSLLTWVDDSGGYSVEQTRNIIEWRAVEAARTGGYDRTILVDQHAYLDLRMLRLAGLDPVYVNIDTIDAVIGGLDRSLPHLLILSPGSDETDPSWWQGFWMGQWPPALSQRYKAYLAELSGFPVLHDTGGPPQRLLWPGPVEHTDRMVLAAVPAQPR